MKKGIFLSTAFALAAGMGMMNTSNQTNSNPTTQNKSIQSNNQAPQNHSTQNQALRNESKTQSIKNESQRGYTSTIYFNPGISPKEYGMRYVKRGTHKRTNI